jgi:hypothetical protein
MNTLVDTSVWSFALRWKPADLSDGEKAIVAELSELAKEGRVRILDLCGRNCCRALRQTRSMRSCG